MSNIMIWLRQTILAAFLMVLAQPAFAFDTSKAEELTADIIAEMLIFIDSEMPLEAKIEAFRGMINERADMPTIARFSLGAAWREANDTQKADYLDVFDDYIAAKYGRQFTRFDGQTMVVKSSLDAGRRGIVVLTELDQRDGSEPIRIEWQYSDRSGAPRIVDIIVEGVSLLSSERQEIGARLDELRGNLDQLILTLPEAANG